MLETSNFFYGLFVGLLSVGVMTYIGGTIYIAIKCSICKEAQKRRSIKRKK